MTKATRSDVYKALAQKANFLVKQETETPKQLRIVGRCLPEHWAFFMPVVFKLLEGSEREDLPWSCDVSRQYLLKSGKVVYGWRLIFQATSPDTKVEDTYKSICSTILSAPLPARVEVDTVLLPGHTRGKDRGGVNAKGKGASSAGSAPMILTRGRS